MWAKEKKAVWAFFSGNGRFYTGIRIIRLDELGNTFVVRLFICLHHKEGHQRNYTFGRTIFRSMSWTTINRHQNYVKQCLVSAVASAINKGMFIFV